MTITKDNALKYAEICCWLAEDGVVQYMYNSGSWGDVAGVDISIDPSYYRRKPKPSLRPWKPEEVPVGAVVRSKASGVKAVIVYGDNKRHIITWYGATSDSFSLTTLLSDHEWKWPQEPDTAWRPCGVEVTP